MKNELEKKDRRDRPRRSRDRQDKEFEQRVIDLARVTRVVAGGKRMRFRACVVIGDQKGRVGMALAKGADVSGAVNKAVTKAKKYLVAVPIVNETIPHDLNIHFKSAHLLMKPAPKGSGVIAGGSVRLVMELAGVKNVVCKMIGSQNKINNVRAVFKAFTQFKKKPLYQPKPKATEEKK